VRPGPRRRPSVPAPARHTGAAQAPTPLSRRPQQARSQPGKARNRLPAQDEGAQTPSKSSRAARRSSFCPRMPSNVPRRLAGVNRPARESWLLEEPNYANPKTRLFKKPRSEEHTSELQSRGHLVCRLLLEKKKE